MKILFTGGGSGGHIFPIIAVVREIRKLFPEKNFKFFYFGPRDDFAKALLSQEGIKVRAVLAGKIRRYFSPIAIIKNIIDILFVSPVAFFQAGFYVFFLAPDIVFSKGGYGSFFTALWSWVFRTRIFLHEADAAPGLTNKLLSKFCSKLFVSFPRTASFSKEKMIEVGNPVRTALLTGSLEQGRQMFGIKGEKPVVLILGGSKGAQRINDLVLRILPEFLLSFEIIHQVGEKNFKNIEMQVKALIKEELALGYHFYDFLFEEQIKQAYAVADLVVSRAGSGAIFEIAAMAKPSILIPLPESAQQHQVKNAYSFAGAKAAVVMEESNISPHFFLEKLKYIISQPNELLAMSQAAKSFAKPNAARVVAKEIANFL